MFAERARHYDISGGHHTENDSETGTQDDNIPLEPWSGSLPQGS